LPRNVKLLGWASLLNDVASEMIFPLLPRFLLKFLGGSEAWLGAIEGTADSVGSLVKLWSGGRSDRGAGRKRFVVFGYALSNLVQPLIGLILLPWHLLALRVANRTGKGIRTSPRDAMIADSTPPEIRGRAFGFHRGMDHLGAAVGPLLAAAFLWFCRDARPEVFETRLRNMFLLTAVPGALVVVLLWLGLREPARSRGAAVSAARADETPGSREGHPEGTRSIFSADVFLAKHGFPPKNGPVPSRVSERPTLTLRPFDRRFRLYLAALVVFTLANSSDAFLLARAGQLGVAVWLLPVLWSMFHVIKSGGNVLCGRLVDRVGPRPMILAGWVYYAGVYLAFALASEAWQVWALFAAYAVFYALTEPAEKTLVANLAGDEHRGLAFGWFNCAVGVATLPSSLLFGVLYQAYGPLAAFGSGAVLALAAAALLSRL